MSSKLQDYLATLPAGKVEDPAPLVSLLVNEWHTFAGASEGGTDASKIHGRCENLRWGPPHLTFAIERHGAVVLGSGVADLHHWCVDLMHRTATIVKFGKRRLDRNFKAFNATAVAVSIVDAIVNHSEAPHLNWCPDGRLKIRMSMLISGGQQTRAYRHKRLTHELKTQLEQQGWTKIAPATFRKQDIP